MYVRSTAGAGAFRLAEAGLANMVLLEQECTPLHYPRTSSHAYK